MVKIAVLGDIHGNLPALEAVLADVETVGVDLIVLNGDLADGPFPAETMDCLIGLGNRAIWLRGNGDRWLVEAQDGRFRINDPATQQLIEWSSEQLSGAHREMLAALPLTRVLDIRGSGRIGFCHATPRSDNEMLLVDSSVEQYEAALSQMDAEIIVVSHCHMPFDRLWNRRRIVNTGSVGMPYGHSGASWLLLGPEIVLRRTSYDLDEASARIGRTSMPGADEFIQTYIRSTHNDIEALQAFREKATRQQELGCFE